MVFWCGEGVRLLHRFVAVAAAAAGAAARLFFLTFSRDSEGTLGSFVVPFGRLFWYEIRWCFGVAKGFIQKKRSA